VSRCASRAAERHAALRLLLVIALCTGACGGNSRDRGARPDPTPVPPPTPGATTADAPEGEAAELETDEVILYFAAPDGAMLTPAHQGIYRMTSDLDRMKQTVAALIQGPTAESGLRPVLPAGTPLRDLYLDPRGVVYVDFGQELLQTLPAGSAGELLAAQALAHTLAANFPAVNAVQILVMGEEIETLTGHLDTTRPIRPDTRLVRLPEEGQT